MKRSFSVTVLAAVLLAAALHAQNTPAGPNPQTVLVDFIALSASGTPVLDLKAEEVTVKIGSRERPVRRLEIVQTGGGAGVDDVPLPFASSVAGRPRNRSVLIVIDDESIRPQREETFRPALSQLIGSLSPSDRVAVVTVPLGGIRADFTTDHAKVRQIINSIGGKAPRSQTASDFACRTRRTLEELTSVLESLGGGEGPISVVFVSSAMSGPTRDSATDKRIGPGMCELVVEKFEELGIAAAKARATFHVLQPEDQMISPGTLTPGDISGTTVTQMVAGVEALAGVTGAEQMRLGGQTGDTVERILRHSVYYAATLDATPDDRGVTRLEIGTSRPGVTIRSRPRVALTKANPDAGRKTAVTPRDMLRQARGYSEFAMRAIGYASDSPGDTRLRIIALAEAEPSARINAAAVGLFDKDGKLIGQWTARPEELTGGPIMAAMPAPPGRYRMRVAATDESGRAATADYDLDAELTAAGAVKLSGLFLGVSREGEFQPRMIFSTEPTAIARVELTGVPEGAPPTARVEIARSLNGPSIASLPAAVSRSQDPTRATLSGVLPIAALTPGDYVIRVVVTAAGGQGRVIRTLRKVG